MTKTCGTEMESLLSWLMDAGIVLPLKLVLLGGMVVNASTSRETRMTPLTESEPSLTATSRLKTKPQTKSGSSRRRGTPTTHQPINQQISEET